MSSGASMQVLGRSLSIAGPSRLAMIPARALSPLPRRQLSLFRAGSDRIRLHATRIPPAQILATASASRRRGLATAPAISPSTASRSSQPNRESNPNPDPDPDPDAEADSGPQPTSAYARFKLLTKKYGWWALGVYTALSAVDGTLCFLTVHAVGVERIEPFVAAGWHKYRVYRHGEEGARKIEEDEARVKEQEKAKALAEEAATGPKKQRDQKWIGSRTFWAEVALAYAIHKTALLPFRAGLTVAWTPKFVGWLTSRGWVGKGGFGRAATHAQGKIKDASDKVKAKARREGA